MPSFVRPVVAGSWRRCAAAGVTADGSRLPPVRLGPEELRERRSRHPLADLLPMFRDLLGGTADDGGHIFAVTDAAGTLLWVEGRPDVLDRAARMHFVEGAAWSEAQAGTNAPGTALAVRRPVRIVAAEHYNAAVHSWSCSAAPIRDPDSGRMLGAVDLTGGANAAGPYALALAQATVRAAEAELARRMATADERARREYAGRSMGSSPAALVSPGGRVLDATADMPGLAVSLHGDERQVTVEPVGPAGHMLVRFTGPEGRGLAAMTERSVVRLTVLGRDTALLEADGGVHRLSPRHSEIVAILALATGGMSGERLAVELSEEELSSSTVRAEMTRLRTVLGADLLGSRPYVLRRPVRSDFVTVRDLLAEGRADEALAAYSGPLLPSSEAPAIVAHRSALEQQVRGAVLGSGDPRLIRRWVDSPWGADDVGAWRTLARQLPGGSSQRASAAARARALDAELSVPPVAAWLQRRGS